MYTFYLDRLECSLAIRKPDNGAKCIKLSERQVNQLKIDLNHESSIIYRQFTKFITK